MRAAALLAAFLAATLGAGCGQKGPLYLRDSPPPGMKAPRPEPYKPVPYPKESGEEDGAGAEKK
jgi:predicted small lipoprotein YifL